MLLLFFISKEGVQGLEVCHIIFFASRRIIQNGWGAVPRPQPAAFHRSDARGVRWAARRGAEAGNLEWIKTNGCVVWGRQNCTLVCKQHEYKRRLSGVWVDLVLFFFCIYILVYFKAATLKKALSDTRGKRMNYMTNLHLLCKRNEHKYRTLLIFDGIWHNARTKLYPWESSWSLPYCSCCLVNKLLHRCKKRCCSTELGAEGCTPWYNR